jgi:hypothetical protein
MRVARLVLLAVVAALAATAHASEAAVTAPSGLHGFLLRADEPAAAAFHRTPSFAWNPVPGARKYQFQLSTSDVFRDNAILYDDSLVATPVAAPPLTLPWITGTPHALYARVRAVLDGETTPWSAPYGFDVTPPAPPTPLPSYPGLLRWTPVVGAEAYEVWLIDTGKFETVRTNVLDEREFYSFHQSQQWIGTLRWRIRALRSDVYNYRINGMPVAMTGAWSPIYQSTNPAMSSGPIKLLGTVSDVFSDGGANTPAHQTMPAFLWSGNQSASGTQSELYRVYAFTDSQCLNTVYRSAVIGSPAWAPRMSGPLSLPSSDVSLAGARASYLGDGKETSDSTYDNRGFEPNEQLPPAKPTTSVPGEIPAAENTTPPPFQGSGSGSSGSGSGSGSSSSGSSNISVGGNLGPPVDLWDVDWPKSGYYWTVIPIQILGLAGGASVAPPGSAVGATSIPVNNTSNFRIGDTVTIGVAPSIDTEKVLGVSSGSLIVETPTKFGHAPGEPVTRAGGSLIYQDMELPQDVCAAGRVQRFGVSSEPSLTTAQSPFATGLSAAGRLVSAAKTPAFYGQPLVAWTPALGASIYQIQWSKTKYPFVAEVDPASAGSSGGASTGGGPKGRLTFSTSMVLPLTPGTWYYRVRGFNFNLPTGVQQMGWSSPEQLVVTTPTFKLATPPKKKFKVVGKP